MTRLSTHATTIDAPVAAVWRWLTSPAHMPQWMGEPEMAVDVRTSWAVGSPIIVSGFHHAHFSNIGTVLRFEPTSHLRYTHLSSLSRLPDSPENHSIVDVGLTDDGSRTSVVVTLSNFPNDVIFKHLDFYWRGTVGILKQCVERA